jgi:hypothetical protein
MPQLCLRDLHSRDRHSIAAKLLISGAGDPVEFHRLLLPFENSCVETLLRQQSPGEDRGWGCSTDSGAKAVSPHSGRRECFAVDLVGHGGRCISWPLESGNGANSLLYI